MRTADNESDRKESTDLDLDAAVASVVNPVCARLDIRSWLKGQHLHSVMLDMAALKAAGANDAELLAYGLALIDHAKTLTSTSTLDDRTLARLQLDADLADDHLRGVIAIEGESPTVLDQYAAALEKTAAVNVAKARRVRKRARDIRQCRATARQRVGLGGAA